MSHSSTARSPRTSRSPGRTREIDFDKVRTSLERAQLWDVVDARERRHARPHRRARPRALGRPATAARHRACALQRPARARARRGDERARHEDRVARDRGDPRPQGRGDDRLGGAPPLDDPRERPDLLHAGRHDRRPWQLRRSRRRGSRTSPSRPSSRGSREPTVRRRGHRLPRRVPPDRACRRIGAARRRRRDQVRVTVVAHGLGADGVRDAPRGHRGLVAGRGVRRRRAQSGGPLQPRPGDSPTPTTSP